MLRCQLFHLPSNNPPPPPPRGWFPGWRRCWRHSRRQPMPRSCATLWRHRPATGTRISWWVFQSIAKSESRDVTGHLVAHHPSASDACCHFIQYRRCYLYQIDWFLRVQSAFKTLPLPGRRQRRHQRHRQRRQPAGTLTSSTTSSPPPSSPPAATATTTSSSSSSSPTAATTTAAATTATTVAQQQQRGQRGSIGRCRGRSGRGSGGCRRPPFGNVASWQRRRNGPGPQSGQLINHK